MPYAFSLEFYAAIVRGGGLVSGSVEKSPHNDRDETHKAEQKEHCRRAGCMNGDRSHAAHHAEAHRGQAEPLDQLPSQSGAAHRLAALGAGGSGGGNWIRAGRAGGEFHGFRCLLDLFTIVGVSPPMSECVADPSGDEKATIGNHDPSDPAALSARLANSAASSRNTVARTLRVSGLFPAFSAIHKTESLMSFVRAPREPVVNPSFAAKSSTSLLGWTVHVVRPEATLFLCPVRCFTRGICLLVRQFQVGFSI